MKRMKCPSSSSSSSSSSSCIESPIIQNEDNSILPNQKLKPRSKTKRVITPKNKKILNPADTSVATSPKSRSSIYRGVTRHRWTGRFEAHLWDKTTWNSIQNKRGKQIYLGAYDNEEDAARTYDLAALKYWGPNTILNFPMDTYAKQMEEMQKFTREEYLASLRRRSSGFSRGVSKYRGVARHHHNGRWEARIGRVCGNKYLYLGTYSTEEEAAAAYDMAAIEFRGANAVTNFDISNYADKLNKDEKDDQGKQEMNPDPLEVHEEEESPQHDVVPHQENAGNVVQQSVPKMESMDSIPHAADQHEHPWDFCLDIGFNVPAFPHVLMEETSEFFDYRGFEDDIECIFDVPFVDNEILLPDAISGSG